MTPGNSLGCKQSGLRRVFSPVGDVAAARPLLFSRKDLSVYYPNPYFTGNGGLASSWGCRVQPGVGGAGCMRGLLPDSPTATPGKARTTFQQGTGVTGLEQGSVPAEALLPATMDPSQLLHSPPARGIQVWCVFGGLHGVNSPPAPPQASWDTPPMTTAQRVGKRQAPCTSRTSSSWVCAHPCPEPLGTRTPASRHRAPQPWAEGWGSCTLAAGLP